jgi:hypothetical protein
MEPFSFDVVSKPLFPSTAALVGNTLYKLIQKTDAPALPGFSRVEKRYQSEVDSESSRGNESRIALSVLAWRL